MFKNLIDEIKWCCL